MNKQSFHASRQFLHKAFLCTLLFYFLGGEAIGQTKKNVTVTAPDSSFDDSHFHLTNYVQEGIDIHKYLNIMGNRVGRSTLFGIPLQQMWSYQNSGSYAPTYYLQSDAPLYYYSFTDAVIAMAYNSLSATDK